MYNNNGNFDFLLYFGIIGLALGVMFLLLWITCQYEIEIVSDTDKGTVFSKNTMGYSRFVAIFLYAILVTC